MDRNKLMNYIDAHREEAIAFLQKLISFESTFIDQGVYGNELEIQTWLNEEFQRWGLETRLFEPDNEAIKTWKDFNPGHHYENRPNLVGIAKGEGGGRSLILNGHIDVVPLDDIAKWKYHPLKGIVEDGKLYGRGAADMKSGVAAMALATRYVQEVYGKLKGDVIIEAVVDEEGGGNGTLSCIEQGYTADAAIVTEPTSLQILCASRGVHLLEIEVPGQSIHACYKWKGINAIEKAMKIASGLSELEKEWLATRKSKLLPSPTITLGQIEGGIGAAVVPGSCIMRYDIKYLPVEVQQDGSDLPISGDDVRREVEERIRMICEGDHWLREHPVKLNWYLSVMPHNIEPSCKLIDVISETCDEVMDSHCISGMPSGADARHLQNNGNIQTIIFGPGALSSAHSINEFVEVEEYIRAIKVLAATIVDWCGLAEI